MSERVSTEDATVLRTIRTRRTDAAPSDAELLEGCRQRDPQAWDTIVDRYERLIHSVALRNGLTQTDAADVTQTTFVELIDALDRIRDEDRLASWLMTVARRQAWRIRNQSRRVQASDDLPEAAHDPFADWGTLSTLQDGLAELGGICRDLLEGLYLDPQEPSYAELAERIGRSVGSVGPMRSRCLQRLRRIIGEEVR